MKMGRYIGSAFTRYVVLPVAATLYSCGAFAQEPGRVSFYDIGRDLDGDGKPEQVTVGGIRHNRLSINYTGGDEAELAAPPGDERIVRVEGITNKNGRFGLLVEKDGGLLGKDKCFFYLYDDKNGKFGGPAGISCESY